jgi:hypothetical protein
MTRRTNKLCLSTSGIDKWSSGCKESGRDDKSDFPDLGKVLADSESPDFVDWFTDLFPFGVDFWVKDLLELSGDFSDLLEFSEDILESDCFERIEGSFETCGWWWIEWEWKGKLSSKVDTVILESLPDLPGIKTDLSELLKSEAGVVLLEIPLELLLEKRLVESGLGLSGIFTEFSDLVLLENLLDLLFEGFLGESGLGPLLDLLLEDFLCESGPDMVERESRDWILIEWCGRSGATENGSVFEDSEIFLTWRTLHNFCSIEDGYPIITKMTKTLPIRKYLKKLSL